MALSSPFLLPAIHTLPHDVLPGLHARVVTDEFDRAPLGIADEQRSPMEAGELGIRMSKSNPSRRWWVRLGHQAVESER